MPLSSVRSLQLMALSVVGSGLVANRQSDCPFSVECFLLVTYVLVYAATVIAAVRFFIAVAIVHRSDRRTVLHFIPM